MFSGRNPKFEETQGLPPKANNNWLQMLWFPVVFTFDGLLSELCHKKHIFLLWWKHKQLKRPKRKITWDGERGMAEVTCKPFPLLSPLDTGWRAPLHPCSWAAGMFLGCDYLASEHGMMSLDNVETINNKSEPSLNWLLKNTGGSPDLKTKSCWLNMLVYFFYFS